MAAYSLVKFDVHRINYIMLIALVKISFVVANFDVSDFIQEYVWVHRFYFSGSHFLKFICSRKKFSLTSQVK